MEEQKGMELLAAKCLKDEGIALPLRLLRKQKRMIRVVMRIPSLESKVRIAGMYLKIGVTYDELQAMGFEDKLRFMVRNTVNVSRMVAYGIVRGHVLGALLNRPVAWLLRTYMHPVALEEAWMIIIGTMSTVPFGTIIRFAEATNLMAPNLSQNESGS